MSGNSGGPTDDPQGMHGTDGGVVTDCAEHREVLSAALDGEAGPAERVAADDHLTGCAPCRVWHEDAAAITRRARTGSVAAGPDVLSTGVLDRAPGSRRWWARAGVLRGTLVVLGLVQLVLGLAAVLGTGTHTATQETGHAAMSGPGLGPSAQETVATHMAHESGAWNLALGAAFLVGGLRPRHLAGLLPALGIFIAVLAVVSAVDLAAGRVDPGRVVTHLVLLAGFVVAALVVRRGPHPGPSPTPGRGVRPGRPVPREARPTSPAPSPSGRRSDVA